MIALNLKVLVLGLGISGKSATNLLIKLGASVTVYDDKKDCDIFDFSDNLDDIELCVVSPGIDKNHRLIKECKRRRITLMSELELGISHMKNDYIAITGTNGKTTTVLLVTEILKAGGINAIPMGNLGLPVTDYCMHLKDTDLAVIEVSSFQLEFTCSISPKIAAIINLAPDHIDRHGNYEDYISTKLSLFANMKTDSRAVFNYDNPIIREFSTGINTIKTFYSSLYKVKGCYVKNNGVYFNNDFIVGVDDIAMNNLLNIENVLCALSICIPLGISANISRKVIMSFTPPDYRMATRGIIEGKNYYNDSKSTNVHSTLSACNTVKGSSALIIGGSDKGETFIELFKNLPDNIKYVLVVGSNAQLIIKAASTYDYKSIKVFDTLKECVDHSKTLDVCNVLFSPASASFDTYKDYAERGKDFDSLL